MEKNSINAKKNKGGVKGKYHEWLKKENLMRIRMWRMNGATKQDIAEQMGITLKTLMEWQNRFSEISEALKIGRETADSMVENALFKEACKGNVAACIFWMKNRHADHWSDHPKTELDKIEQMARVEMMKAQTESAKVSAGILDNYDAVTIINDCPKEVENE